MILKHDLSRCRTELEKTLVSSLLEIQALTAGMGKGMQEAVWRVLVKPTDEMADRGIIKPKKNKK